ncbi:MULTISPECIES: polysaccharide deacetylase family protein [Alphaproteobacteria]|uniref:Chitooligosaccharide deacetylase n=2 Tax=Alphaproteobacteria TaxID=28211 RepID=A0A512HIK1_9HYPH|nr:MULTISPECIES: polysaccharide deacetylase family protein [Alphaproteobacteria]GEO85262.1 glycosyl transferase [Ciceribacter naphthalenivorans]GLR20901.1 glycosyl transferase [Ciceribacter naphthalenivorans]GLT03757.1 glycosyl transferase [Sphingomonas psychrolutea]
MLAKTLVLTFHGLNKPIVSIEEGAEHYFVSEEIFRRTISSLDALEARSGCRILVTFDDGNLSDYEIGMPVLLDAGRKGHFFVLAGRIGQQGYLSGAQMREMVAAGMAIGSHGWDHVDWRKLDAEGRQREYFDARRRIEDETGVAVREAAIPFGAFDHQVLHDLKGADYEHVNTSTSGLCHDSSWFRPRWSATRHFVPEQDLPPRLDWRCILKGTAYAQLRRLRYRI